MERTTLSSHPKPQGEELPEAGRLWQARKLNEAKDTDPGGFTTFHCLHPRQQAGLSVDTPAAPGLRDPAEEGLLGKTLLGSSMAAWR
ncbi:hypothetical protein ACRRTK_009531 [Alexandromys fortis]